MSEEFQILGQKMDRVISLLEKLCQDRNIPVADDVESEEEIPSKDEIISDFTCNVVASGTSYKNGKFNIVFLGKPYSQYPIRYLTNLLDTEFKDIQKYVPSVNGYESCEYPGELYVRFYCHIDDVEKLDREIFGCGRCFLQTIIRFGGIKDYLTEIFSAVNQKDAVAVFSFIISAEKLQEIVQKPKQPNLYQKKFLQEFRLNIRDRKVNLAYYDELINWRDDVLYMWIYLSEVHKEIQGYLKTVTARDL